MRHYRATHLATAQVVEYDAELPLPEHLGSEWALDEVFVATASLADPQAPAPTNVKITKLAFRNRFFPAEKAGIEFAGLDDPSASLPARLMAASLRANQADINAATYIDLMRPETRGGVEGLEYFGLIGIGRADVILDTPPVEHEVWNGQ